MVSFSKSHLGNWLFYLITVGIVIIIIWYIVKYVRSIDPPPEDTFYFMVTDIVGNKSCVHDSGIRPSKTKPGENICFQVLKEEYDSGVKKELTTPYLVEFGMNPKNLKWKIKLESSNILADDLIYYIVNIESPDNPFYGRKNNFPIDDRKECRKIEKLD